MSDTTTLARPYASALFELAVAGNIVEPIGQALAACRIMLTNAAVSTCIHNPAQSKEAIAEAFLAVCEHVVTLPAAAKKTLANCLSLLSENGRLGVLGALADLYDAAVLKAEDRKDIVVTSAFELSAEQREALMLRLEKRFGASASVSYEIDPAVLGGAVIRAGNWVMDGSISGKLARLNEGLL